MLTEVRQSRVKRSDGQFAIVASEYNAEFVDAMVKAAVQAFEKARAKEIRVIRVPGAFEIPAVAAKLAQWTSPQPSAIVCLGVILRGETAHAQHIGEAVSHALAKIQVEYQIPVVHEVLLLENAEQARVRCMSERHNRGAEAAHVALVMSELMKKV